MNKFSKKISGGIIFILTVCLFYFFITRDTVSKDVIDVNLGVIKAPDLVTTVDIAHKEMIQVRFSWEVGGITYNDALNFTKEAYEKLTLQDIEHMKNERFSNWVTTVNESSRK